MWIDRSFAHKTVLTCISIYYRSIRALTQAGPHLAVAPEQILITVEMETRRMKELRYVIQDELGIHARPAGLLVKKCGGFSCDIRIGRPDKMVDAKRVIGVMSLGMKCGNELLLTFDGTDEEQAVVEVETFLRGNL